MSDHPPAAGTRSLPEIRGRIASLDADPRQDPFGRRRSRLFSALPLSDLEQHLPPEKIADADFRAKWGQTSPEQQILQALDSLTRVYGDLDSLCWLLGDAEHRAFTSIPAENIADRIMFVSRLAAHRTPQE